MWCHVLVGLDGRFGCSQAMSAMARRTTRKVLLLPSLWMDGFRSNWIGGGGIRGSNKQTKHKATPLWNEDACVLIVRASSYSNIEACLPIATFFARRGGTSRII